MVGKDGMFTVHESRVCEIVAEVTRGGVCVWARNANLNNHNQRLLQVLDCVGSITGCVHLYDGMTCCVVMLL